MPRIVLASNNASKAREINAHLGSGRFELVPQAALAVTAAEETGLTFVENAILKARHAATATRLPAIADDSGIEVDALQGRPGIRSARFAGLDATDQANNTKLLAALEHVPEAERSARFQCVIVYLRRGEDPTPLICSGTWEGKILFEPAGDNGFGYDPLFFVPTHNCSSARLPPAVKNTISQRAQALNQLAEYFR